MKTNFIEIKDTGGKQYLCCDQQYKIGCKCSLPRYFPVTSSRFVVSERASQVTDLATTMNELYWEIK